MMNDKVPEIIALLLTWIDVGEYKLDHKSIEDIVPHYCAAFEQAMLTYHNKLQLIHVKTYCTVEKYLMEGLKIENLSHVRQSLLI